LYVSGMIGWGTYTPEDGAIHRVRHVGGDFPTLIGHEARDNGVLLRFDRPFDSAIAGKVSSHFAQCWNYRYGPAYGSPEYSVKYPESPGHDVLAIKSAQVLDGGKTVFLEIPQLVPASQIHLHVGIAADRAQDVFLTAHHLGQPFVGFPGYVAVPKDKTHEHVTPVASGKANAVKWEIEMCRGPVREMKLQTGNALQYAQKELRAKAGEGIALKFENPDIMPHNFVLVARGAEVWRVPTHRSGRLDLLALARRLGEATITSVLVEGGGEVHASLLAHRLADELVLYVAPKVVGGPAPSWDGGAGLASMQAALPFVFDEAVAWLGGDLRLTAVPRPVPDGTTGPRPPRPPTARRGGRARGT
jgi:hypothetical protein